MTHSPEPWSIGQQGCRHCGDNSINGPKDRDGRLVVRQCLRCCSAYADRADMARIVACVNACAGIPTEKLEGLNLVADFDEVAEMVHEGKDD